MLRCIGRAPLHSSKPLQTPAPLGTSTGRQARASSWSTTVSQVSMVNRIRTLYLVRLSQPQVLRYSRMGGLLKDSTQNSEETIYAGRHPNLGLGSQKTEDLKLPLSEGVAASQALDSEGSAIRSSPAHAQISARADNPCSPARRKFLKPSLNIYTDIGAQRPASTQKELKRPGTRWELTLGMTIEWPPPGPQPSLVGPL